MFGSISAWLDQSLIGKVLVILFVVCIGLSRLARRGPVINHSKVEEKR